MPQLNEEVFALECEAEVTRICDRVRELALGTLARRGVVIGISGGVDSAVCAALCARALSPARVCGLLMPERESSPESRTRGRQVAASLGIEALEVDMTAPLEAIGAYAARDAAIRAVFPDYGPGWRNKLVIAGGQTGGLNFFRLVVQDPGGRMYEKRMPARHYLQLVAAQNHKQRLRKAVEYFHADRLHHAVIGTPNRLEYDQGFFVKNGDGAADIKPIAHLYKTQVYALARHLGLPAEVCSAPPTTDTYSLPQGQDEFYFALPYQQMDLALWAHNHGVVAAELGAALGVSAERAALIYKDIESKRETTRALHSRALLIEPVPQVRPLS